MLKTPAFWYRKATSPPPIQELLLRPASTLYACGHTLNQYFTTPYQSKLNVICVGNAVTGGSGKTPVSIALANLLKTHTPSLNSCFLSRGYQGKMNGPALLEPDRHTPEDAGDEPFLLSQSAPCYISKNRAEGLRHIEKTSHHNTVILDDGLQNRSVHKTINLIVIDGMAGFGNQKLFPAGPLREQLDDAFEKTDAFILVGKDHRNIQAILPDDTPLFLAHVQPGIPDDLPTNKPLVAFAGLGRPEKFYLMLHDMGYEIAGWHPYPDHYAYTEKDIKILRQDAEEKQAQLVTTEKDYIRLKDKQNIAHIPISIKFQDEALLASFIKDKITKKDPVS